jgi:D-ribose pyranase
MLIVGILNSKIASLIACSGHMDEIIVCDAGFPIPLGVETIDLALSAGHPDVLEVLAELVKYFAVEKVVMANETKAHSPSQFRKISALLNVPVETMPHTQFKQRSHAVKGIIRTGDFTAYSNVLLVSGPGDQWFVEQE